MRLYGISEEDIAETIADPDAQEVEGAKTVSLKKFGKRFQGYPLKVVHVTKAGGKFIITAYPLKRKAWRQKG